MKKLQRPKKILVVDDNPDVLEAIIFSLSDLNFPIVSFSNPEEALTALKKNDFGVILADQNMPKMSGLELLGEAKKKSPYCSRILLTGAPQLDLAIDAINRGSIYRFLTKPWSQQEIKAAVLNGMNHCKLISANEELQYETKVLNEQLTNANHELQIHLSEITRHKLQLDQSNRALQQNLQQCLELCYHITSSFHPLLGEQTKSVVEICKRLAVGSPLNDGEIEQLIVSSWLQNIGLIGISRDILFKYFRTPSEISQEEMDLIKKAPIQAQSLASFNDKLIQVGTIIRSAHERWDGTGYPDRLEKEMIPRPARYLAVAVAYVESSRNKNRSLQHIQKESGKAFDPEVVKHFFKTFKPQDLPSQVYEVTIYELRVGMKLASPVRTSSGLLLVSTNHVFDEKSLGKIEHFNEIHPIEDRFLVYKEN